MTDAEREIVEKIRAKEVERQAVVDEITALQIELGTCAPFQPGDVVQAGHPKRPQLIRSVTGCDWIGSVDYKYTASPMKQDNTPGAVIHAHRLYRDARKIGTYANDTFTPNE